MKLPAGWSYRGLIHGMILLIVVLLQSGCASTETQNASERPWNTPKSWENGLPSGMYEGR